MSDFSGGTLLITGGTGSFGNAVLKRFIATDIGEIRIFSRDEKKQDDMRHELQLLYPNEYRKVKFYIGDVRSKGSIVEAMSGVDFVFHAAALKQVPNHNRNRFAHKRTTSDKRKNRLPHTLRSSAQHRRIMFHPPRKW